MIDEHISFASGGARAAGVDPANAEPSHIHIPRPSRVAAARAVHVDTRGEQSWGLAAACSGTADQPRGAAARSIGDGHQGLA